MFKPKFTITNKINNCLLEIERARGFLEAAQLINEGQWWTFSHGIYKIYHIKGEESNAAFMPEPSAMEREG